MVKVKSLYKFLILTKLRLCVIVKSLKLFLLAMRLIMKLRIRLQSICMMNQYRLQISFSDIEIPKYTAQSIQHDKVKGIGDVRSRNQKRSPENTDWLLVTPFIVLEYKK